MGDLKYEYKQFPYIKYVRVIEENRDVMRYCRKDIHECDV